MVAGEQLLCNLVHILDRFPVRKAIAPDHDAPGIGNTRKQWDQFSVR